MVPGARPAPDRAATPRTGPCAALVALALGAMLFGPGPWCASADAADGDPLRREPITPIPAALFPPRPQSELGRRLFHDPRLSKDGKVSCATCHPLDAGGMDGKPRSVGVGGPSVVNTPTVFNAALQFAQFWDARAVDVRAQVDGPLTDAREMANTWDAVLATLEADKRYRATFRQHYPDADRIRREDVRDALGSFVETLVTPGAPFDRWLQGEAGALTDEQIAGYARFKALGCIACHQGVAVGGNMLQVFGIMGDYFADRGTPIERGDLGRFNVTRAEEDRHRFKVPSLRNVAVTAPYFHDGSAARLEDAVRVMVKYQLGREASADDVRQIVAFLESLTGQWQGTPVGRGGGG